MFPERSIFALRKHGLPAPLTAAADLVTELRFVGSGEAKLRYLYTCLRVRVHAPPPVVGS
jgi:hypothetical protein